MAEQFEDGPPGQRFAVRLEGYQVVLDEVPFEPVGQVSIDRIPGLMDEKDIEELRLHREVALEFDLAGRPPEEVL